MDSKKSLKVANRFECNICYYNTSKRSDFNKHLSTRKHKNNVNDSKMIENEGKISQKIAKLDSLYSCECGKQYKYDSGYYRHKKTCHMNSIKVQNNIQNKNNEHDKNKYNENSNQDLMLLILKENKELKQMIIDVCKNGLVTNNVNSNNVIHNKNKNFNLQFFLNETCKDAMNISDFVENIKIQLEDLEKVGKLGYVEGISNIIVKNLEDIDVNRRPLHCSDVKRETMYIKDEDKWEKDSEQKEKMKHVVRQISKKNSQMIPEYKAKYAECSLHSDSKIGKDYGNIIVECVGGMDDNMMKKENDIIKQVASKVAIVK